MVNEFLKIIEVPEVEKILENLFNNLFSIQKSEYVELEGAHHRVLSEDIYATIDLPPFDRASKDGYAVHAPDTFGASEENPIVLNLLEVIEAGQKPQKEIKPGFCSVINTGAPLPKGASGVVMVEYTEIKDNKVHVYRPSTHGQFITKQGTDIKEGELLLSYGTFISSDKMGVLSSMGLNRIPVQEKIKVAIISTGKELVNSGQDLKYGQIFDVNSYSLQSAVLSCGAEPLWLGVVPDNYDGLADSIKNALKECNIILTSGSTSAGTGDVLKQVIEDMGEVLVHGISVKPGKPTIIGKIDEKIIIGLPGYPVAALMIFQIFLASHIRQWGGLKSDDSIKTVNFPLEGRFYSSRGRLHYALVKIIDGKVHPILKDSGAITALAEAQGYIKIPKNVEILTEGSEVEVVLFDRS
ncbi:MAG: molybdopterin-binding protein [Methanobacteriaceae archaeon]|nr:molybdopterin-binding protein [Methanobacteriaceae archaeon]